MTAPGWAVEAWDEILASYDRTFEQTADLTEEEQETADELDRLTAENARLNRLIDDTASHWLALQTKHPIAWEGAIDEAMRAACDEITRLRAKLSLTPENVERVKSLGKEGCIELVCKGNRTGSVTRTTSRPTKTIGSSSNVCKK